MEVTKGVQWVASKAGYSTIRTVGTSAEAVLLARVVEGTTRRYRWRHDVAGTRGTATRPRGVGHPGRRPCRERARCDLRCCSGARGAGARPPMAGGIVQLAGFLWQAPRTAEGASRPGGWTGGTIALGNMTPMVTGEVALHVVGRAWEIAGATVSGPPRRGGWCSRRARVGTCCAGCWPAKRAMLDHHEAICFRLDLSDDRARYRCRRRREAHGDVNASVGN